MLLIQMQQVEIQLFYHLYVIILLVKMVIVLIHHKILVLLWEHVV